MRPEEVLGKKTDSTRRIMRELIITHTISCREINKPGKF
jgi:hypothetical protein